MGKSIRIQLRNGIGKASMNKVSKQELLDVLSRAQSFASTISIYNGKDPDELNLYRLEATSLRDLIHFVRERLENEE